MYNPRHYIDLQDNSGSYRDSNSWLSDDIHIRSSPPPLPPSSAASTTAGRAANVDRGLYNDLVEIVPLIQSLIDRKASSSFTRRGSIAYTKTPSRHSLSKNHIDSRGRNAVKSVSGKKRGDLGANSNATTDGSPDGISNFTSTNVAVEKDREELIALSKQVEDLQQKLLEKDELLKEAENSRNQMSSIQAKFEELKQLAAEKDILIKSSQQQLYDAKIKLADKQAALEKLQWEASTSNQKVEKLQEEVGCMESQVSSYMLLLDSLSKDNLTLAAEDYDILPYHMDPIPCIDGMDEIEFQTMEEARQAYVAAVAASKENPDEDSLAAAATARLHLQSFVLRTHENTVEGTSDAGPVVSP
ncbi:hypothetical protein Dimus_005087 [Dionaea muscipula]